MNMITDEELVSIGSITIEDLIALKFELSASNMKTECTDLTFGNVQIILLKSRF